jgi:hypothetical protein
MGTHDVSLDPLRWDLNPYCPRTRRAANNPINAKCETVRDLPTSGMPRRSGLCQGAERTETAAKVSENQACTITKV